MGPARARQEATPRLGVAMPRDDSGKRTSSRFCTDVVAASLQDTDPSLAAHARSTGNWRKDYVRFLAASTQLSVRDEAAVVIARAGLAAAYEHMAYNGADGVGRPLSTWVHTDRDDDAIGFDSETILGSGPPQRRLEVPYRGRTLHGVELEEQLEDWVRRGVAEPAFAEAINEVIRHAEWLSMPGHRVILFGAASAMGPLTQLAQWQADVVAVDVAAPAVVSKITSIARMGAGRVTMPVEHATGRIGADLAGDIDSLAAWFEKELTDDAVPVVAAQAYADGAAHIEINLAADALGGRIARRHPSTVLSYLNTPTDSFLVPEPATEFARSRMGEDRWHFFGRRIAASVSGNRLFQLQYDQPLVDRVGGVWGLCDALVDVQGPNYALAKRIQRWRAVLEHAAGRRVSTNVAPASWTASVTKNRALASAYAGARPFGVEIFEASTAQALMAAKLVADCFGSGQVASGHHPESIFVDALHGGLWRQPFQPRSALGVAALIGLPRELWASIGGR